MREHTHHFADRARGSELNMTMYDSRQKGSDHRRQTLLNGFLRVSDYAGFLSSTTDMTSFSTRSRLNKRTSTMLYSVHLSRISLYYPIFRSLLRMCSILLLQSSFFCDADRSDKKIHFNELTNFWFKKKQLALLTSALDFGRDWSRELAVTHLHFMIRTKIT